MQLKDDADDIRTFMQELASKLKLDGARKHWPKWLYRSDHVVNAANILNSGFLLSRAIAENRNLIAKDSASPELVKELSSNQRNLVRLYFRPRTPTNFRNEGIRPINKIWNQAHMPVPVYLLISSKLLQYTGVKFTNARLTETSQLKESAKDLAKMNFKKIYHEGGIMKVVLAHMVHKAEQRYSQLGMQRRSWLDDFRSI